MWNKFMGLGAQSTSGSLWIQQWTFQFQNRREVLEQLLDFQAGFCSIQSFGLLLNQKDTKACYYLVALRICRVELDIERQNLPDQYEAATKEIYVP